MSMLLGLSSKLKQLRERSDDILATLKKGDFTSIEKLKQLKKDALQAKEDIAAAQSNLEQNVTTTNVATQAAAKAGAASAVAQGMKQLDEYRKQITSITEIVKNLSKVTQNISSIYTELIKIVNKLIEMQLTFGLAKVKEYLNKLLEEAKAKLTASLSLTEGIQNLTAKSVEDINKQIRDIGDKIKTTTDPTVLKDLKDQLEIAKIKLGILTNGTV